MKIGFIGTGNMGGAILRGYASQAAKNGDEILAYNRGAEKLRRITEETGATATDSIGALVEASDIVILGVKPNMYEDVLPQIAEAFTAGKIFVSMAAGVSIRFMESYLGKDKKIVRIMPNTPASVGLAMTSVSRNDNVTEEEYPKVISIFEGIGKAEDVEESLVDVVGSVSGSSPAYTYMYIEALVSAAVRNGMAEDKARIFAAQAVKGAAELVLQSEESLEQLRVNVCSPGGTTIEAVQTLFDENFPQVVEDAFDAALAKSKKMTK